MSKYINEEQIKSAAKLAIQYTIILTPFSMKFCSIILFQVKTYSIKKTNNTL